MRRKETTKMMNNKGFSLVELIIVIAIMAILIGVLAPQFMKYVERSRKSTDVQNVASIVTALQVYATDPMVASGDRLADGAEITLTDAVGGVAVSATNATGNAHLALQASGINTLQLRSSNWPGTATAGTVILEVDITNGDITVTSDVTGEDILTGVYDD